MPLVPVDINTIKLDPPPQDYLTQLAPDQPKYAPVDINSIQLDQPAQPDQPSVGSDVVKSIGGGLERGAAGAAMMLPNMLNQAVAGPQMLYRGIRDTFQGNPTDNSPLFQPFFSSEDVLQSLPEPMRPHNPQTAAGVGADLVGQLVGNIAGGKAITAPKETLAAVKNAPAEMGQLLRSNSSDPASRVKPIPTASDLRSTGGALFQKSEQMGGSLQPKITDAWVDEANTILPQTAAGKTLAGESETTKLVERMQDLKGKPLTLSEAQEADSILGNEATKHVDPKTGKLLEEGAKIKKIQESLRQKIESAGPNEIVNKDAFDTWKEAKNHWAASYRMNDVERIMQRAEMSDNPVTVLRNGFKNLVTNKANLYGYTKEEIKAMQHAARTGIITGALKTMGSRLMSGMAGTVAGAAGGGMVGAPIGLMAGEAVGFPLRATANAMQRNRANNVRRTIAKRVE